MSSITLIIRPYRSARTGKPVHGQFQAHLDGRLICISRQPLLDSARVLAAEAIDPATPIAMRHEGAAHNALRSTVGKAAKLTVEESAKVGPRIICCKPISRSDVGAPMRFFGSPVPDTGTPAEHISDGGGDMIRRPTRNPVQPGFFVEIVVTRDRVTDEGVFLNRPPGAGWRVHDAHRERHTTWQRRSPEVRRWRRSP